MLKVGILGASGFIGSRTAELFCLENVGEVRPIVRAPSSLAYLAHLDLDVYTADALDQSALHRAFADLDVVVHAVIGSPWFIRKTVVSTYQAAQKAGVRRLVYLSTACVHGHAPDPKTDEHSPLSDRQPIAYNNAKVQAERKLLQLREKGSTEIAMLRPAIVVGPRSGWAVEFANALLSGTAHLVNEGKAICNSVYIDNLVHAISLAMTAPDADGQAFLVGDREQVTWADLYRPITEALGFNMSQIPNIDCPVFTSSWKKQLLERLRNSDAINAVLSFFPEELKQTFKGTVKKTLQQPGLTQEKALLYQCQYKLPYQKAETILGYEPIISFTEGCDRTIAWLTSEGYPIVSHKH